MKNNGFFVAIEKTSDGLGGTTQVGHLYENLKSLDRKVIKTREMGGTELGLRQREMILFPESQFGKDYKPADETILAMIMADRAEHVNKVVLPHLEQGYVVITDRFSDSTAMYQGAGAGFPQEILKHLHKIFAHDLKPDITIVLDGLPFKEYDGLDTFERKGTEFYKAVRTHGLYLAQQQNHFLIDANRDERQNAKDILNIVLQQIEAKRYGESR